MKSHWRRFSSEEWAEGQSAAYAVHFYSSGDVLGHCAGPASEWRGGGEFQADRLADLPSATQQVALRKLVSNKDGQRMMLAMAAKVPKGYKVIEENRVPHVWLGQEPEEV